MRDLSNDLSHHKQTLCHRAISHSILVLDATEIIYAMCLKHSNVLLLKLFKLLILKQIFLINFFNGLVKIVMDLCKNCNGLV